MLSPNVAAKLFLFFFMDSKFFFFIIHVETEPRSASMTSCTLTVMASTKELLGAVCSLGLF